MKGLVRPHSENTQQLERMPVVKNSTTRKEKPYSEKYRA
jgi:hypothetical protein